MILGRALPFVLLLATACGSSASPPDVPPASPATPETKPRAASEASVVDAPDRTPADRELDKGRHPRELLAFAGIRPGMKVAELMAGGGYTAELLARAVGPTGVVYGQNNKFIVERYAAKPWGERLAKPVMKNVVRVDRELEDPLPAEAKDLDAVFMVLFYHDTYWMDVDRSKLNAAVHKALKPGGIYVIVDHSGRSGTGSTEVKTLHRIEEGIVRADVQKAGFKLAVEASFLRNAADTRDWNDAPTAAGDKRGTSDRFVFKFVK